MNSKASHHATAGFILRNYVELLTLIVILFVVQTGLVPYDFLDGEGRGVVGDFFDTALYDLRIPDIISNIFLYLPLAAMLHWSMVRRIRSSFISAILAIILSALISGGIEYVQSYSPLRISSLIDWVSNVLGAVMGVLLSWIVQWFIPKFMESAIRECRLRPRLALLITYSFSLLVIAVIPFSFSFDVSRLKQCVKSTNLTPFHISQVEAVKTDPQVVEDSPRETALIRWYVMNTWSRWIAEFASFMLLVWFLQPVLRGYYGFKPIGTFLLSCWIVGGLAILLSALQIPVISRTADITDVLFRFGGMALGMVIQSSILRSSMRIDRGAHVPIWKKSAWVGCVLTGVFIAYCGLIPFDFSSDWTSWEKTSASTGFLPFHAYYFARFDLMMTDALTKSVAYIVFAVMFAAGSSWLANKSLVLRIFIITSCSLVLSVAVEIVQLYMPIRVTSLTDPILAGMASIVGVIGYDYAVMFYKYARSPATMDMDGIHASSGDSMDRDEMSGNGLSVADEMIAGIAEPYEDAPREPDPSATPIHKPDAPYKN